MNRFVVALTARQLLGQRRTLLMMVLVLLPFGMAVIFRVNGETEPADFLANHLYDGLLVGSLLPLVALVFGTAALGAEIDDGTAIYLLSKPIPRWRIVGSKLVVAATATAALIVPVVVASGLIALDGAPDQGLILGFSVAALAGAVAYTAFFLLLSVLTGRALIAGLVYVFIWEEVVTRLFKGTRFLSIREYERGIADAISSVPHGIFAADLGGAQAVVLAVLVVAGTVSLAVRRLQRFEIGEAS